MEELYNNFKEMEVQKDIYNKVLDDIGKHFGSYDHIDGIGQQELFDYIKERKLKWQLVENHYDSTDDVIRLQLIIQILSLIM